MSAINEHRSTRLEVTESLVSELKSIRRRTGSWAKKAAAHAALKAIEGSCTVYSWPMPTGGLDITHGKRLATNRSTPYYVVATVKDGFVTITECTEKN